MAKKILIVLGIVVAAIVIAGLVLPKEMTLERFIVIEKPRSEVFTYLLSFENGQEWSPWAKMDPDMKTETRGSTGEVGNVFAWDGNKDVGRGEQEIVTIIPNERIDMDLRFFEPMEGDAKAWFVTEEVTPASTKVTWGFHSVSKFPFNIICAIMNMGGMMENIFDQGLADMKAALEK